MNGFQIDPGGLDSRHSPIAAGGRRRPDHIAYLRSLLDGAVVIRTPRVKRLNGLIRNSSIPVAGALSRDQSISKDIISPLLHNQSSMGHVCTDEYHSAHLTSEGRQSRSILCSCKRLGRTTNGIVKDATHTETSLCISLFLYI